MLPYVASYKNDTIGELIHHGVKGMHWGVRHNESGLSSRPVSKGPMPKGPGTTLVRLNGKMNTVQHAVGLLGSLRRMTENGRLVAIPAKDVQHLHRAGQLLQRSVGKSTSDHTVTISKARRDDLDRFHKEVEEVKKKVGSTGAVRFNKVAVNDYVSHGIVTEARAQGNLRVVNNSNERVREPGAAFRRLYNVPQKGQRYSEMSKLDKSLLGIRTGLAVASGAFLLMSDLDSVGGAMATRDLLMSDLVAPDNYAGALLLADLDISHSGVKGMKWGVRHDRTSGSNKTHVIRKFEKPHGKEQRKEARKATINTGSRSQVRQAVTESAHKLGYNAPTHTTTVAALQAHIRNNGGKLPADGANVVHHDRNTANLHVWKVGRPGGKLIMQHMATFQQMTPNGKIRKVLRVRPGVDAKKVMDSLNLERITSADLKKTAMVNLKASPGQKIFSATQNNMGAAVAVKTLLELNRSRAASKSTSTNARPLKKATQRKAAAAHSSLPMPQDYIGAFMTGEIEMLHFGGGVDPKELQHYGVRGMHWGVRKGDSGGSGAPRPTLARAREDRRTARADQVDAIRASRPSIASGETSVVRNGKILSTRQALKSVDKEAEKLSKRNPVAEQRAEALKQAHEEEKQKTLAETEHQLAKFNRLEAQLKAQGVHSLLDDELKFVNSRNEAMKKAKDVYNKPSWLRATVTAHAKKIASEALLGLMQSGYKAGSEKALVGATRASMQGFNRGKFSKSNTRKLTPPAKSKLGPKFDRSKFSKSTSSFGSGHNSSYTRGGSSSFSTGTALVRAQPLQNYAPRTGSTATGVPIFNVTSLR